MVNEKREPILTNPHFILTEPPTQADLQSYAERALRKCPKEEDVTLPKFFLADPFKKIRRRAYLRGAFDGGVLATIVISLFVVGTLIGTVYANARWEIIPKWEQTVFRKSVTPFAELNTNPQRDKLARKP